MSKVSNLAGERGVEVDARLELPRADLPDVTARIDSRPIVRAEIHDLQRRFGVPVWFGFHTRRWWALVEDHLVEAATPARLGDAVMAERRWTR